MTQADQELLDKQFQWLRRSRADDFLAFFVPSVVLFVLLLASGGIA